MRSAVRIIARPALAPGFLLAGLPVVEATDGVAAGAHLKRLAADPAVGVVLVDGHLYDAVPRDITTRLERQAVPVVAPVPAPTWVARAEAEAFVLEILRQAIGYRVRPR